MSRQGDTTLGEAKDSDAQTQVLDIIEQEPGRLFTDPFRGVGRASSTNPTK